MSSTLLHAQAETPNILQALQASAGQSVVPLPLESSEGNHQRERLLESHLERLSSASHANHPSDQSRAPKEAESLQPTVIRMDNLEPDYQRTGVGLGHPHPVPMTRAATKHPDSKSGLPTCFKYKLHGILLAPVSRTLGLPDIELTQINKDRGQEDRKSQCLFKQTPDTAATPN